MFYNLTMNKRQFGNSGEDIACQYLENNGYQILERNKHYSRLCEIDIIAKFKNRIIFVEVKTRKTDAFGSPFEAITKTKYNNIKTGALSYIKENNYKTFQIDVIGITYLPELKIQHLRNI